MTLFNLSPGVQYPLKHERIQTIDFIRGVDIVLMVLFNYSVTLSYFGLVSIPPNFLYWYVFPRAIASVFIFLSGVVACASFEKRDKNFRKKYFMRGGKLLVFSMLISVFTLIFVPEMAVYFGILHFFAVSSFLLPFFIRYDTLNLIGGLFITISGFYLQRTEFNFPYLLWLGFIPENFSTFDYFPLIPWLGILLLGVYSGKYIIGRTAGIKFENKLAILFMILGKKSLTIYLIHQPVLIILLTAAGFKLF